MLGSAIIVFRETLEAALIISIIAVATVGLPHRARWITGGIAGGIAGSLVVAMMTERIAEFGGGMGQELFNAGVLGIAVLMLAWHNIWMARHGMPMARETKALVTDVRTGNRAMSALAIVISLAVLREGSETALFLYSLLIGGSQTVQSVVGGGFLGLGAGALAGWGLYAGFVRIPVRWFFSATSILVLALSAAIASNMARFLVAADVLPALADPLWDSSAFLDQESPTGTLLHLLIGYEAQPLGMQVVAYVTTLTLILLGMWHFRIKPTVRQPSANLAQSVA
jgi:high-affinity iron transporter